MTDQRYCLFFLNAQQVKEVLNLKVARLAQKTSLQEFFLAFNVSADHGTHHMNIH